MCCRSNRKTPGFLFSVVLIAALLGGMICMPDVRQVYAEGEDGGDTTQAVEQQTEEESVMPQNYTGVWEGKY